jgi:lysozyme family protein
MSRNFDFCAKRVLGHEGGEVNDRRDPGGHTNLGITQSTLNHARHIIGSLPATVDKLSQDDALEIYQALYWHPVRGDELPLGVALIVFDAAVNQGVGDAVRFLQLAVKTVPDGVFGSHTLKAAQLADPRATILEVGARRMFDYMQLDHLEDRFGLGWSRRLMAIVACALEATRA